MKKQNILIHKKIPTSKPTVVSIINNRFSLLFLKTNNFTASKHSFAQKEVKTFKKPW